MESKLYRMRELINPTSGRSLIVDTSAGLSLGALPGLERFTQAVTPLLARLDGLVTSPGGARRLLGRTREQAAILVRADWTNSLRGHDFVLHPETTVRIPLLEASDALDLGASAVVVHFLLGHEEQVEADCLRMTVQLALQGGQVGMPVICDVLPNGPRVVLRSKAIELGVSYALEAGADGVAVPWPGRKSFETIRTMLGDLPIWIKPTNLPAAGGELTEALELGATGLWLDEAVFAQIDPLGLLTGYAAQLHQPMLVGQK